MSCLQQKFAYIDNSPSKFEPCGDYRAEMFWEAFEKALPSSDLEVHLSRYSFLEKDYSLTKTLLCAWRVIVGDPQKKEEEREERCALFGRSVAWVLINNVPSEVLRVALKSEWFGITPTHQCWGSCFGRIACQATRCKQASLLNMELAALEAANNKKRIIFNLFKVVISI